MANSDKDILITPSKNQSALPSISFVGQGNVPIDLNVLDSNNLSFEGTAGQLFSITNNLSSGNIFSVNDISGVPSIAVNANGRIDIARYNGNVNIGSNSNATDKTLCVTGNMALTTKDSNPAEIHFYDGGTNTGNGVLRLGFDGPSQSGNTEYLFLKDASGTAHWSMTQAGAIGIRNTNPRTRLHLIGEHTTTQFRMTLPSANNGGGTGEINMQMWVSEGGRTWDAGGIGMNVSNYNTASYPSSLPNSDNGYFPRLNSNIGSAYIRFIPNGGRIEFSTRENNGTSYREQIHMRYGCIGVNRVPQNSTDKIYVYNGDINIEGGKYKLNGQEFTTLPTQNDTTRGAYLVSDGGDGAFWAYPGNNATSAPLTGFRYRSIITHGYIAGGYKGSQPWRSVNKTWHATDTTYYCGEQLDRAAAYTDGTWSDYNAYVHGVTNSYQGNSSQTSSYNLHTGILRAQGDSRFSQYNYGYEGDNNNTGIGYNVTGGWAMNVGRNDSGCATNQKGQAGYITGGGNSATNKLHFPTEIMYTTTNSGDSNDFVAGVGMENKAYFSWRGGSQKYMNFSNDSFTNQNFAGSNRGWCKALPSKYGHFYIGTSNNNTTPMRKVRGSDGAALSNFNRARRCGEENWEMGQDWGYKMGDYNGQQNNHVEKWTYSNDAISTLGSSARPKGHYGQSSAACSSAAASVTATRP
tara:strand:- start:3301 stop:5370 length:2070 start_codon:yes stop_codon:yes gene_type:complete